MRKGELSKEWPSFMVNPNARPGKNTTFYKTHKPNVPVRLLTTRCNTIIENLVIFVEKHCAKLTENIPTKINDSYHLIDISETMNAKGIPDNAILVCFDIVSMFSGIDSNRDVAAVKNALDSRTNLSPSTECIIEALEICLTNTNSTFTDQNFIQTNGTTMVQLIFVLTQIWQFNQQIRQCCNGHTEDNFSKNYLFWTV